MTRTQRGRRRRRGRTLSLLPHSECHIACHNILKNALTENNSKNNLNILKAVVVVVTPT